MSRIILVGCGIYSQIQCHLTELDHISIAKSFALFNKSSTQLSLIVQICLNLHIPLICFQVAFKRSRFHVVFIYINTSTSENVDSFRVCAISFDVTQLFYGSRLALAEISRFGKFHFYFIRQFFRLCYKMFITENFILLHTTSVIVENFLSIRKYLLTCNIRKFWF